jgi:hypothetical protein
MMVVTAALFVVYSTKSPSFGGDESERENPGISSRSVGSKDDGKLNFIVDGTILVLVMLSERNDDTIPRFLSISLPLVEGISENIKSQQQETIPCSNTLNSPPNLITSQLNSRLNVQTYCLNVITHADVFCAVSLIMRNQFCEFALSLTDKQDH